MFCQSEVMTVITYLPSDSHTLLAQKWRSQKVFPMLSIFHWAETPGIRWPCNPSQLLLYLYPAVVVSPSSSKQGEKEKTSTRLSFPSSQFAKSLGAKKGAWSFLKGEAIDCLTELVSHVEGVSLRLQKNIRLWPRGQLLSVHWTCRESFCFQRNFAWLLEQQQKTTLLEPSQNLLRREFFHCKAKIENTSHFF